MELLHFTCSTVWRGHEQMIIDIYESLRDNELVKNQIIVCPTNSKLFEVATQRNLKVIGIDFKSQYNLKIAKQLKHIVDINSSSIVLLHNSKAHTVGVISSVFCGLKIPLVLFRTLIKNVGTNFFRKFKYNYKGIKKIVCVSDPVVDILKATIKNHQKMVVVGSVVDTEKFIGQVKNGFLHKEFNIPSDYKIVGNVSAFCKVKDHYTWVNTVEELYKRGLKAKYILIGEGGLESEIKEYVKSKGLENEIIFAGFRNDVHQCIPEFDLFLFTSNNEATGGVILESYACKVPVVAARAGGIPTVLEHNETGLLAEVGNAIDFADKVEFLINCKESKERYITKGHDFLMKTASRVVIGYKINEVLSQIMLDDYVIA
ncbi:glycosyltransferase [Flavobacterium sp. 7A]|uniref:glycosyltransferase n=1 Tax=Flavobacterium sp. 7A TaxID=2940571 RepID=UPI002227D1D6|nr:glycosyltransferase [Flavobacterium sp. 7A]MCW2118139.1 glycosyltransferase involved in cell wall biosynthesis [Flavobacterium sp. 7A]